MAIIAFALLSMNTVVEAQQKPQQGDLDLGISYVDFIGLTGKISYNIIDPVRLEVAGTTLLGLIWDWSANVHYLFPVTDRIAFYPMAGVSRFGLAESFLGVEVEDSFNKICFNFGGGMDIKRNNKITFNIDLRFVSVNREEVNIMPMIGFGVKFQLWKNK